MGVRNIIAVDGDAHRLDMAKKLGAKYCVNFMEGCPPGGQGRDRRTGRGHGLPRTGSAAASMVWKYVPGRQHV